MSGYVLGCDVGTTGTKTVLFSSDGKAVKRAYRSYPTFTDGGISEQNAADLWTALCMTVREAVSDVPPESVGANIALDSGRNAYTCRKRRGTGQTRDCLERQKLRPGERAVSLGDRRQ